MIHKSTKALLLLGILAALTGITAQGGGSASDTTTNTLSSISSIKYGSVSNAETLEIAGTPFGKSPGTIIIMNKSTSAAAARIMAACYKNAQFAAANGGQVAFTHKNLNSKNSGITGATSGSIFTVTFTEGYPASGEITTFSCEASSAAATL